MKRKQEYLENFGKKYYLFGEFYVDEKVVTIPVYYGSLRSILKYTTYKDVEKNLGIYDEDVFKKVLKKNLLANKDAYFDFNLDKTSFFMAPNKEGKNKTNIRFCDSRDVLFCNSEDLYASVRDMVISSSELKKAPEEKINFAAFICKLIDENYKEKLHLPRESHDKTTNLDILRKMAGGVKNHFNLKNVSFEELVLFDSDILKTAFEMICKDFIKKEELINMIYTLTGKKQILSEDAMEKRSYFLTRKLKDDFESRKFIENKIFDALSKQGLIKERKKDFKVKNELLRSKDDYELEACIKDHDEEEVIGDDEYFDDFLGPEKPNDPRYRSIN